MIYLYYSKTCYVCFTLETPFIAYLLWKWFCFSLLSFLFCFRFCFSSMCYTDVCNVLALNVHCHVMPNTIYVMLCYVMIRSIKKIQNMLTCFGNKLYGHFEFRFLCNGWTLIRIDMASNLYSVDSQSSWIRL